MTAQESITMQELNRKLDIFMDQDKQWKEKVEKQIQPLVDDRLDHQILQKYGKMAFKAGMAVLGAIATGLIIARAIQDFLIKK